MQVDDAIAAVRQFHTATGSPVADKPRLLPGDQQAAEALAEQISVVKSTTDTTDGGLLLQRAAMAIEELAEWLRAHAGGDLVGAADAWADRAYVLFGAAVATGLPAGALLAEVHRSNMSKDLVADGTGKATKGREWGRWRRDYRTGRQSPDADRHAMEPLAPGALPTLLLVCFC